MLPSKFVSYNASYARSFVRLITILSILLPACTTAPKYIFIHADNVPAHPSFIVLAPPNDLSWKSEIEQALLNANVSVFNSVQNKNVVTTSTNAAGAALNTPDKIQQVAANAKVQQVEEYSISETSADLAILLNSDNRLIKIINVKTSEIVSIFTVELNFSKKKYLDQQLFDFIGKLKK